MIYIAVKEILFVFELFLKFIFLINGILQIQLQFQLPTTFLILNLANRPLILVTPKI